MCMAALHWARVDTVYYGASIADATAVGFNELHISAADIVRQGGSHVRLVQGVLAVECIAAVQGVDRGRAGAGLLSRLAGGFQILAGRCTKTVSTARNVRNWARPRGERLAAGSETLNQHR